MAGNINIPDRKSEEFVFPVSDDFTVTLRNRDSAFYRRRKAGKEDKPILRQKAPKDCSLLQKDIKKSRPQTSLSKKNSDDIRALRYDGRAHKYFKKNYF